MPPAPSVFQAVATLQSFLARAEALRAILLLDRGDGAEPVIVDCLAGGTSEVEEHGATRELAEHEWLTAGALGPLPDIRPFPPLEVDLSALTVAGPIGSLDFVAGAVRDLAQLFPDSSVLTVGFETTDAHTPLFLASRRGEPMVAALGEEEYELPPNWPPPRV